MNKIIPNLSMKNNILIYVTGILMFSIIVVLGIWYSADLNQKAENRKKEDQKIALESKQKEDQELAKKAAEENKNNEQKQIDLAEFLSGKTYSLTKISLLKSDLVFPNGKLTFAQSGTFSLEMQGLDLAILEKPELKVGDAYPTVSALINGVGVPAKDGASYNFNFTNLQLQFFNGTAPLDSTGISAITQSLAKNGIDLPTASFQNPVIVNSEIKTTATYISVNSTPSSKYLLNFEGSLLL